MKTYYLILLILIPGSLFAQQTYQEGIPDQRETAKNELSVGALNLVAFGALDVAYERIVSPNSSWGVEAFLLAFNTDSDADAYEKDFSLTGKYKYFFADNMAWGFYINGLAMMSTGESTNADNSNGSGDIVNEERYSDLALGFGLGGKFISRQGFFMDMGAGLGRNLFSSVSPTIVGQFIFNLGYRF